jgi:ribonuclease D
MNVTIEYIDSQEKLTTCVNRLKLCQIISVDLEFDKNHYTYGFNICLIQVFDGITCFLIDPLPIKDLSAFYEIINDPNIEKLTFAFGEDLRLFVHLGCKPKNVLDLAVARNIAGLPTVSLTNALILDVEIHSQNDLQRSNWCKRPLSEDQKIYAAEDVIFLPQLREKIVTQLEALDRFEWLKQEMESLDLTDEFAEIPFESTYYKELKEMTLLEWERFKAIHILREKYAKQLNLPTYKVMDRAILIEMAEKGQKVNWQNFNRMHPSLKKSEVKSAFFETLQKTEEAILDSGIDPNQPARKSLSREEIINVNREKVIRNQIKDQSLLPLKEVLTKEYGEVLSTFLLSKRLMDRLISGEYVLPNYRKEIFIELATKYNIPVAELKFLHTD